MLRVGFIGLGLMGKPMTYNLLKAGFPVVVYNRSRPKVDELVAAGAGAAESPADLTSRVDIVCSCVPKPPDVVKVYLGAGGVLEQARAGQVLIDMSTIDAGTHQQVAAAAATKGAGYLDAPVSGGTSGARDGTLTIMVGGDAAHLETARPVLEAMGKRIYHVGPVGSGAVVKLINNMLGGIHTLAAAEALVLGTKAGIDPALLTSIIMESSGASRGMAGTSATALSGNFAPGFMIDLAAKDLRLAIDLGNLLGVRLLAGSVASAAHTEAIGLGLGQLTTAALIQPLEKSAGVEVRRK
jgi:3-hydroxyisobutyrate dehydrogenase-like beta-hydroxyacid dehydrogenase